MSRRAARVVSLAGLALLGGAGAAPPARADEDKAAQAPAMDTRTVRSGLVIALGAGWGLSQASGYPNSSTQIGDPAYYSSTNLLLGNGSTLFLGWALADYVNFGIWFGGGSYKSHDWVARGGGAGFRIEAFPLTYVRQKILKGVGAFAQLGVGSETIQAQGGNYPEAKGVQSFLGIGAMWEFTMFHLLGGHAVAGPTLEYDAIYSSSVSSGAGVLGGRIAFYGGP